MGVETQLQPGEEILYRAHVTRISLIPWVAALVLVVAGAVIGWQYAPEPAILLVAGVLAAVLAVTILVKLVVLRSNEHVLTNRRMIQQTGVFNKRSMDAPLDKVNNVEHWQTLWGRLLGYGDVEIDTASEHGATRFSNIARPLELKSAIVAASEAYRSHRFAPAAAPAAALPSGAERMRQLKSLLDDGLISPEEFEAKRRRLLEEI
ncbi:MAG TPA: PH domain-containing protein [Thermoanaerobaculia bacterium]|nr:PH domain-containing protein [Thermoanaerobaculia bacterium]